MNYTANISNSKGYSLKPKTIEAYSRALRRIGDYFNFRFHLDALEQEQLLNYFHALLDRLPWSSVKLDLYELKFFYVHRHSRFIFLSRKQVPVNYFMFTFTNDTVIAYCLNQSGIHCRASVRMTKN